MEFLRENEQLVCGTVNARNRMGGYAGAEPFIAGFCGDTLVGVAIIPWREAQTYGGWLLRRTDEAAALRTCGFIV